MKKVLMLAVLSVTLLAGCAAFEQAGVDARACLNDPICYGEAVRSAQMWKKRVGDVTGVVSPVPWAGPVAGGVTGVIALGLGLIMGGRKRRD